MSTVLGCIADDFTGATDLAGLLARSGVQVSLRMGVPSEPPKDTAPFEVIALKCRTAPVAEAIEETGRALDWLRAAGAQRFFWKYCSTFDSTAEGNIGPVAEALMAALDTTQTIYCPAFPENGRAIFMGNLFVGQQPLAESSMKDHPLTPMRDSNLMRLLAPQVRKPVGLVDRLHVAQGVGTIRSELARLEADGVAHVVVDAVETPIWSASPPPSKTCRSSRAEVLSPCPCPRFTAHPAHCPGMRQNSPRPPLGARPSCSPAAAPP